MLIKKEKKLKNSLGFTNKRSNRSMPASSVTNLTSSVAKYFLDMYFLQLLTNC